MIIALACTYCIKPRKRDRLMQGRDRLTKQDAWACPVHVSFLKPLKKRDNKEKTA